MTLSITTEPSEAIPLTTGRDDVICISGTRVTLDTVVNAFLEGASPEEIVYQYPSLELGDVYAVVGYYLRHRYDVEDYLDRRRMRAQAVHDANERLFPSEGVRTRLLARRQQSSGQRD